MNRTSSPFDQRASASTSTAFNHLALDRRLGHAAHIRYHQAQRPPTSDTLVRPPEDSYFKLSPKFRDYRESVVDEDDDGDVPMRTPPGLESDDVDMLSEEPTTVSVGGTKISLPTRFSERNIPKLSDIGIDKVQTHPVFKQPNHISEQLQCPPAAHFTSIAKIHLDFTKLPGPLKKRKFFGFDSEELLHNGALNCTPCRPSNLIYNPVLTIFQEQNFLDVPQPILEVLKPALALAECIILKGNPRFWVDIACGMRAPDYGRMQQVCSRAERLIPVGIITTEMKGTTMAKLLGLGKRLLFKFESLDNVYGCANHPNIMPMSRSPLTDTGLEAAFASDQARRLFTTSSTDPWNQQGTISFDSKLYAAAKLFSVQKYPDEAARLRFNFFFAVNLLHEVSHLFESKCGHGYYYELISKDRMKPNSLSRAYFPRCLEPKYKDYEPEMGAAFECETFGGRVHPINHDFTLRYGLNVYFGGGKAKPSDIGHKKNAEGAPYGYGIPMSYIEEIQQQSFWEEGLYANGLKIPKSGPRTYVLHTTSTQDWRDHLLEHDPSQEVDDLEQAFDDSAHISKRLKLESAAESIEPSKTKQPQRFTQTQLRKYPSKAHAAAAQMKADLISQATRDQIESTQSALKPKHVSYSRESYQPPPPTQPAIDECFSYANSIEDLQGNSLVDASLHDLPSGYDPLTKLSHQLTLADKWFLLEDYALITLEWDSSTFLAKRALMLANLNHIADVFAPIPQELIPTNNEGSWTEVHCNMLRELRETHPDRGLLVHEKEKHEEKAQRKEYWRIKAEMEELVSRLGGSRVEWLRGSMDLTHLGLEGMSAASFDERFKPMLLQLRIAEQVATKKAAEEKPVEETLVDVELLNKDQGNKITRYLHRLVKQALPAEELPHDSDEISNEETTPERIMAADDQTTVGRDVNAINVI